ncbi:MAG TPA: hypothetical protein VNU64_16685 [Burkholderiales bacterium]|nr:hypothetical protein [Burkholderiales bacterium]
MLEEILELNRRAAAQGEFEVAYHLLMAALHAADREANEEALTAVKPPHHLSRRQALARGQTSVFDSFVAHLDAVRLRLQSQRQLKR